MGDHVVSLDQNKRKISRKHWFLQEIVSRMQQCILYVCAKLLGAPENKLNFIETIYLWTKKHVISTTQTANLLNVCILSQLESASGRFRDSVVAETYMIIINLLFSQCVATEPKNNLFVSKNGLRSGVAMKHQKCEKLSAYAFYVWYLSFSSVDVSERNHKDDNITFSEDDLVQAVNLAEFSNDRLKT